MMRPAASFSVCNNLLNIIHLLFLRFLKESVSREKIVIPVLKAPTVGESGYPEHIEKTGFPFSRESS